MTPAFGQRESHQFGWSGRHGIDRCVCGTERELREFPHVRGSELFWWYRLTSRVALEILGYENATNLEGRKAWPCPVAA